MQGHHDIFSLYIILHQQFLSVNADFGLKKNFEAATYLIRGL